MPKTKDDRRSRRQDNEAPYHNKPRGFRRDDRDPKHRGKHEGAASASAAAAEDEHAPCASFDAMNLKPDLLKGIYAYGFEKPSAIQQRAIRPIVRGRDVIAQSQSGTGKTVSQVFCLLNRLFNYISRSSTVVLLKICRLFFRSPACNCWTKHLGTVK